MNLSLPHAEPEVAARAAATGQPGSSRNGYLCRTCLAALVLAAPLAAGGWWWLPRHNDAPPLAPSVPSLRDAREIWVTRDDKVFFENVPMTLSELEQRLIIEKALTPDFPVVLRCDAQAHYQSAIDVLDLLGRLGLNRVGLATRPNVK